VRINPAKFESSDLIVAIKKSQIAAGTARDQYVVIIHSLIPKLGEKRLPDEVCREDMLQAVLTGLDPVGRGRDWHMRRRPMSNDSLPPN
jgi:hypothetical protein